MFKRSHAAYFLVGTTLLIAGLITPTALAEGEAFQAATTTDVVEVSGDEHSMVDYAWVIFAASLVMLMQAGFMCLESGLARAKNSINVAVKNMPTSFCRSLASG
ncbi:hypothetical protein C5Y96_26760 [Blastopirellula marina]|uniref:Ammonium transporter AmtB-like domain-containing protein n=1 Tax=Blastopirellula marina TaxID=124 RepID=A0A2S8EYV4_9BACT|nr:hypothetical protein C5Y96_26760 [Blastopirellula marina]RCS40957.1 hypothetical protein DTL36_26805 [Bremerella cremea]